MYNVTAKKRYTARRSTPRNHAERPPFVTNVAVTVAISTINTAPGQRAKSMGDGATT
jgi:hypothetical protein